jgi:hypothetical protein
MMYLVFLGSRVSWEMALEEEGEEGMKRPPRENAVRMCGRMVVKSLDMVGMKEGEAKECRCCFHIMLS